VLPALRQLRNVGLLRWGGCRAVVPQRARLVAALAVVGAPPVALPSGATLDVSALDGLDAADAHASLRGGRAVEADLAAALADGTVTLVTPPATVFVVDFGVEQLPGPGDARTTTLDFVVAADAPARGALAVVCWPPGRKQKYSTRPRHEFIRRNVTCVFHCLRRTRREKTTRPRISRNDVDSTERERFEVSLDGAIPLVVSGAGWPELSLDGRLDAAPPPPDADGPLPLALCRLAAPPPLGGARVAVAAAWADADVSFSLAGAAAPGPRPPPPPPGSVVPAWHAPMVADAARNAAYAAAVAGAVAAALHRAAGRGAPLVLDAGAGIGVLGLFAADAAGAAAVDVVGVETCAALVDASRAVAARAALAPGQIVDSCVDITSSSRLQCEHTRRFRREFFRRASSTTRPNIGRIDFDVTELEHFGVRWGPPNRGLISTQVDFRRGDARWLRAGAAAPAPRGGDVAIDRRADLLLVELFDCGCLGERVLAVVGNAWRRALRPDAAVVPRACAVRAVLVADAATLSRDGGGVDVSCLSRYGPGAAYEGERLARGDYEALSEAAEVLAFDLSDRAAFLGERSPERGRGPARRTVRARRGGTAVAVAFFFDLDLADGIALTTEPEALAAPAGDGAPARASHWPTAVQRLPPRELAAGEPVDVVVAHDGQRVSFAWADDEDGRAPEDDVHRILVARHDARLRELRRVLAGSAAPRSVALADAALALSGDPSLGPVHGDLADALGRDLFL